MKTNNDDLNLGMFKAFDIRTIEYKLTEKNAVRLLKSIYRYFTEIVGAESVVLGRDARLGVPYLMQSAIDIFSFYGMNVIVNPLQISTCQFYYSCMNNTKSAGIMFTASHNPKNYVGLKIMIPGVQAIAMGTGPGNGIESIKNFYIENKNIKIPINKGKIFVRRYLDSYIDYSLKLAKFKKDQLKGLSVIGDFFSGSAGTEIIEALEYCGAEYHPIRLIPNGLFPLGDPNPIMNGALDNTIKEMKKNNYDVAFAYDGDGDRMDVIEKRGCKLAPSFNFASILPKLKESYSNYFSKISVFSDVKVHPLAQSLQNKYAKVSIIRNGHSFIKDAMRKNQKNGYIAGCEESAHYYLNLPYDINDFSKGFAAVENTLYFTLISSEIRLKKPDVIRKMLEIQSETTRINEWPVHFSNEKTMQKALMEVENHFRAENYEIFDTSIEGRYLDSKIMRIGIPKEIDSNTNFSNPWLQISQRISRSEDNIARWEVTGSKNYNVELVSKEINDILKKYLDESSAEFI